MKAPKAPKALAIKKAPKEEREKRVLIGLVAHFLSTGKPVGSEVLKESLFRDVSSATIRNYFVKLEEEGYLEQQHTSGGRVPTDKAFRAYADFCRDEMALGRHVLINKLPHFEPEVHEELKEVVLYLQQMTETLSEFAHVATFLSAPRFDQDFVVDMKLIAFDQGRYLAALLTNFGLIHTEILHSTKKLSQHTVKRIEAYFHSRLTGGTIAPDELDKDELEIAHRFYQEAMARYLVGYSNFSEEDLMRAGFSKLLRYPEFQDAVSLTSSLSLFENRTALNALIRDTMKSGQFKYWIGSDLLPYITTDLNCTVIACPYRIGQKIVGCIGLLGPMRIAYGDLFRMLEEAAEAISKSLTKSLYKFKISYRTSDATALLLASDKRLLLEG